MAKDFTNIQQPLPLGLRNNNPGNLRPLGSRQVWVGQTGNNKGFVVFKDISYGIRAMAKNAITQILKNGNNTVEKYITAYAPPKENDTAKYIKYVCSALNLRPNDPIPVDMPTFIKLIRIHLQTELSDHSKLISDKDIIEGIAKINDQA
jgi:hypothetical protein